jgi:hypothetical protein
MSTLDPSSMSDMRYLGLGSVAGPVIQASGRSEFEDGLGSGDFLSGYSSHMSCLQSEFLKSE